MCLDKTLEQYSTLKLLQKELGDSRELNKENIKWSVISAEAEWSRHSHFKKVVWLLIFSYNVSQLLLKFIFKVFKTIQKWENRIFCSLCPSLLLSSDLKGDKSKT